MVFIMGNGQKKITGRLTAELVPVFNSRLFSNSFDMEQDSNSKELRIYPIPKLRKPGYYPYCAVLEPSGLKLTYLNIPEFKDHHKTLVTIFKEVLELR